MSNQGLSVSAQTLVNGACLGRPASAANWPRPSDCEQLRGWIRENRENRDRIYRGWTLQRTHGETKARRRVSARRSALADTYLLLASDFAACMKPSRAWLECQPSGALDIITTISMITRTANHGQ
jgi:hypothetical protein